VARIYQATDLSRRCRQLLDAARADVVHIRDADGTALVLLKGGKFDFLRALRDHFARFVTLQAGFERPRPQRRATDLGEFCWLDIFDDDDQSMFRNELLQACMKAIGSESLEPIDSCVTDWRTTARALSIERNRWVLESSGEHLSAFEKVKRPP
jgi:hypothetical protein